VIFFGLPADGHTNPTLAVVKELVDRGEEVIYYSFDFLREKIEKTGAIYRSYNLDLSILTRANNANFTFLYRTLMQVNKLILNKLLPEISKEKPDYIIHDSLCSWGKYIAEILGIPAISSITVFAFSKESSSVSFKVLFKILVIGFKDLLTGIIIEKMISSRYKIKTKGFSDAFMSLEKMNIIYTSKDFQPGGEFFDASFKFVGPSINNRDEKNNVLIPEANKKPLVYISLGTIANHNPGFFEKCFVAFGQMDLLIILSVGDLNIIKSLHDVPDNFIVREYVPQLEILTKAAIFITHGGMNSVHESLYNSVPMIVVPQHDEQAMVAERVDKTGAGIYLKTVTPDTLRASVLEVLNNNSFKTNCGKLSESMKLAGGYKKAVDEIFAFKLT